MHYNISILTATVAKAGLSHRTEPSFTHGGVGKESHSKAKTSRRLHQFKEKEKNWKLVLAQVNLFMPA